tara:strand:- start:161 stop:946 length:786 start_codon:yes stop_codon:yes gene_type:complete
MNFSLIITTYNSPDSLLLVLKSVETQYILPNEIIIADDGSLPSTKLLIDNFLSGSSLIVLHSWQKDKGFRAAKSRNKAIAMSTSDYIILIDGDTILHPSFSQDHLNNVEPGCFIQGKRVLLTKNKTRKVLETHDIDFSFYSQGLLNRLNSFHSNVFSRIFSKKNNYLRGIKTCNMSFFKKDCFDVNGFNNDMEGWGREDTEFVVRLMNNGINRKDVYFNLIQFHLWHENSPRDSLSHNEIRLKNTIINKLKWCANGINKFL